VLEQLQRRDLPLDLRPVTRPHTLGQHRSKYDVPSENDSDGRQAHRAHLLVDLHGEDALPVEDLDGEGPARARVPRQPHLPEVALPERPPHLVLPHPPPPPVLARRRRCSLVGGRPRTPHRSVAGRGRGTNWLARGSAAADGRTGRPRAGGLEADRPVTLGGEGREAAQAQGGGFIRDRRWRSGRLRCIRARRPATGSSIILGLCACDRLTETGPRRAMSVLNISWCPFSDKNFPRFLFDRFMIFRDNT
jgi:hypothetical protein